VGLTVGALALAGCGTLTPRREGSRQTTTYLPLELGATWHYTITGDDGRRGSGTIRVDGIDYGGSNGAVPEYRVRADLLDATIWSWDDLEAGRVTREQEEVDDRTGTVLAEATYDPPITVLDEREAQLVEGAAWPEVFLDTTPNAKGRPKTKRAEAKWKVESVEDRVSVPAGTFVCLRVRRTQKHHPALVSWYAKGVGLVQQIGAGPLGDETLALTEANLP
jgi:hypothetical protein